MLAFPCNQFGGQEPNSNSVIEAFAASKSSFAEACDTGLVTKARDPYQSVKLCSFPSAALADSSEITGLFFSLCQGCPFPMFAKSTVNEPMCANVGKAQCTGASDQCCGFNNPVRHSLSLAFHCLSPLPFLVFSLPFHGLQVYDYLRGHASDHGNIPWNFVGPTRNFLSCSSSSSSRSASASSSCLSAAAAASAATVASASSPSPSSSSSSLTCQCGGCLI